MKSNKKIIDDSIMEEKKEKMSNANLQSKSSINLNSSKKVFPSSQKNFKPKCKPIFHLGYPGD